MQDDKRKQLLSQLQEKLCLSPQDCTHAEEVFRECSQLLKTGTEAETILQVMRLGRTACLERM